MYLIYFYKCSWNGDYRRVGTCVVQEYALNARERKNKINIFHLPYVSSDSISILNDQSLQLRKQ